MRGAAGAVSVALTTTPPDIQVMPLPPAEDAAPTHAAMRQGTTT
jgi:hypothetical protein